MGFSGLGVAIGRSLLQKIERGRDREIAPTEERSAVSGQDGKDGSGGVV